MSKNKRISAEIKASELFYFYYNRMEHTLRAEYDSVGGDMARQFAINVVDTVLEELKRVDPSGTPVMYWVLVKHYLEQPGGQPSFDIPA